MDDPGRHQRECEVLVQIQKVYRVSNQMSLDIRGCRRFVKTWRSFSSRLLARLRHLPFLVQVLEQFLKTCKHMSPPPPTKAWPTQGHGPAWPAAPTQSVCRIHFGPWQSVVADAALLTAVLQSCKRCRHTETQALLRLQSLADDDVAATAFEDKINPASVRSTASRRANTNLLKWCACIMPRACGLLATVGVASLG